MDVEVPATADRTGIWFARVVKALVLGGLLAALWGHEYLKHYDPFALGSGLRGPSTKSDIEIETLAGHQYLLRHSEGETFYAWVALHNDGRWPVTIERIKTRDFGELALTGVVIDPTGDGRNADLKTFEPTHLDAGETVQLGVEVRYGPCRIRAGDSMGVDSLPMRYSLFGMTRFTELELSYMMIVKGYRGRVCADPDDPALEI